MLPGAPSVTLALAAGMLTVLSPCILPVLPIVVGSALRSHRLGPLAMAAGLVTGFALAGSLLGVAATWFAGFASLLRTLAIAALFGFGLLALFPDLSARVFARLKLNVPDDIGLRGLWREFWLGSQLGLVWSPCAGPVLGAILTLAAVEHAALAAFGLLTAYGLGAALPILLLAYGGRTLGNRLLQVRSHSAVLQRLGGLAISATALAILFGWDVQVQLWLAPLFPNPLL